MKLLKALNKSPLVTLSQKDQKIQLQACEHGKNINRFRLSEKLEHANQLTSRHVYELDALTKKNGMTNYAYTFKKT